MREHPSWTTRCAVVLGTIFAEAATLVACGEALVRWGISLSRNWQRILEYTGSLLICLVAPAAAFWLVRLLRRDARLISWAYLVPVGVANVGLAFVIHQMPAGVETSYPRWAILVSSIAIPGLGAIIGSLIPRGCITLGDASAREQQMRTP
jgi:hypothetical protein